MQYNDKLNSDLYKFNNDKNDDSDHSEIEKNKKIVS